MGRQPLNLNMNLTSVCTAPGPHLLHPLLPLHLRYIQDLVVPAFKQPSQYRKSPYMGGSLDADTAQRDILAFFLGDLRMEEGRDPKCLYSRYGPVRRVRSRRFPVY